MPRITKQIGNQIRQTIKEAKTPEQKKQFLFSLLGYRTKKQPEKSTCCGAPLIGGAQCETCGADGRPEATQDKGSPDYPLGGMVEPYDIEREKAMIRNH